MCLGQWCAVAAFQWEWSGKGVAGTAVGRTASGHGHSGF